MPNLGLNVFVLARQRVENARSAERILPRISEPDEVGEVGEASTTDLRAQPSCDRVLAGAEFL
jgi:hypothetical protein